MREVKITDEKKFGGWLSSTEIVTVIAALIGALSTFSAFFDWGGIANYLVKITGNEWSSQVLSVVISVFVGLVVGYSLTRKKSPNASKQD